MSEKHLETLQNIFQELLTDGNLDSIEKYYAEDYRGWGPAVEEPLVGTAALRTFMEQMNESFSGLKYELDDVIQCGNRLAVRWHATAQHTGTYTVPHLREALAPMEHGRAFAVSGMSFCTFNDEGKIVDVYQMVDYPSLSTQLKA